MKILAIDTSSTVAAVALLDEEKLICEFTLNHGLTHSQKLMPMIEEVISSSSITIGEVDFVAVAAGPGSFTGLRIGGATAKGIALGIDKPIVSVPTLDGLAFNLPFCQGLICPIMDARRDQVYTGIYKWEMGNFYTLKQSDALALAELLELLNQREDTVTFLGDGVKVHRETIVQSLGDRARFAPSSSALNRASSIGQLALERIKKGEAEDYHGFAPFYLRKSQAEREYDKKHGGCGE